MNILIVVCLYDRFENLRKWAHAWEQCEQLGAKLYIVNNTCDGADIAFWSDYCRVRGIKYLQRPNVGFETGIIQDVVLNRIIEENWDVLFFFTDDTLPIKSNFLSLYLEHLKRPEVGVCCMTISGQITPHIRTTGWAIKREEANSLRFPVANISKKEECYHFEHTGGEETLMSQILNMGKLVIQQSSIETSAVWDTHHTKLNRWEEWHSNFPNYN